MLRTIGLMSGTSLDGVDAAYLETDGEVIARFGPRQTLPYDPALRRALRALLDRAESLTPDDPALLDATRRLTERHAEAVEAIGLPADLVGFHGQTILHRPVAPGRTGTPFTWQIGDAALLARRTGMSVAYDFRSADVAAGGQGAPLVPVFHRALAAPLPKPLAILNLGGVGNVSWLGPAGEMLAFDTGPANGPLDDWARQHTGKDYDVAGKLALAGQAADFGRDAVGREQQRRAAGRPFISSFLAPLCARSLYSCFRGLFFQLVPLCAQLVPKSKCCFLVAGRSSSCSRRQAISQCIQVLRRQAPTHQALRLCAHLIFFALHK